MKKALQSAFFVAQDKRTLSGLDPYEGGYARRNQRLANTELRGNGVGGSVDLDHLHWEIGR